MNTRQKATRTNEFRVARNRLIQKRNGLWKIRFRGNLIRHVRSKSLSADE